MLFHLITNVWGERHTELFLRMTLPNVLSTGNLPALAGGHDVRYRIYTTPVDRARIEESEPGRHLARLVPVEYVTPLGERKPDVSYHVHWFHRTAAEAKRDGAIAVFIPPDTLWSDGTFRRCGEVMAEGYKAAATPFLQVALESCLPDAIEKFGLSDGTICIPAAGLYELASRHLHPLTALAMPGSRHGRPALELYWPVPAEGIVSRFAVRELFAFDPRRCPLTFLWYAGGSEDREGIYLASGPHDMGMLSVDHLDKYIENYIVGHKVTPADLVRSTLHPLNNTEQTRVFTRQRIAWYGERKNPALWRRIEAKSDNAMREVEVRRIAQRLWALLRELGCYRAAGILALALEATPLAKHWREDVPLTVFVPNDEALAAPEGHRYSQRTALSRIVPVPGRRLNRIPAFILGIKHRTLALPKRIARRVVNSLRARGYGRAVELIKRLLSRIRIVPIRPAENFPQAVAEINNVQPQPVRHWLDQLLAVGSEQALMRLLRRHIFASEIGQNAGHYVAIDGTATDVIDGTPASQVDGCNVIDGPYTLDGLTVWVVDGVFTGPACGSFSATA